ncbi:MAG: putative HTH-type transcriptional regulator [Euryarchaeota archaeon ADurb.Bin023]|jgi:anthranilate phosphoribosyltransferase|nr:MAG: putative HTH-type transcriptional regulator [Euryarchaeota archaeon ADurb.Bin023]
MFKNKLVIKELWIFKIRSFKYIKSIIGMGDIMVVAFALIVGDAGKEKKILESLKSMKEVEEAYIVYGEYDIVVKVNVEQLKDLDPFLTEKIRNIDGVQMTSTMIAL